MSKRGDKVAARFQRVLNELPVRDTEPGVQPLNPGHFLLERVRTEARPKDRDAVRPTMVSKR